MLRTAAKALVKFGQIGAALLQFAEVAPTYEACQATLQKQMPRAGLSSLLVHLCRMEKVQTTFALSGFTMREHPLRQWLPEDDIIGP